MARERVKLTDKQEKILVQAQLMGLTTADMVRIGNRLKAIERERQQKAEIDEAVSRFTYEAMDKGWKITDSTDGLVYQFSNRKIDRRNSSWNYRAEIHFDILVEKPGTRYQPRAAKAQSIYISDDWGPAKLMPEKSRELYGIMRGVIHSRFNSKLEIVK